MQKTEIIKFLECPAAEKRRRQRARRSWTAVESQLIGATKKIPFSNRRAKAYTTVLPINRVQ